VDPDLYSEIRMEFMGLDDEAIIERLVSAFHQCSELQEENLHLKRENTDLVCQLEDSIASLRVLEKEKESAERYRDNLRTRYRKLCAKREGTEPTIVVREIEVLHEDSATIDALRAKCDDLKQRLWEYQKRERESEHLLQRLRELEARNDEWQGCYHAVVLRSKDRKGLPELDMALIDSKDYFKFRHDQEAFEQDHRLKGPYLVKELPYGR